MKKFDINNYQGKYVMHCKTEEEAKTFCNYLRGMGKTWNNGGSYDGKTEYSTYKERTCYYFNDGMFGHKEGAMDTRHTILEFSDFDSSSWFTKTDLKTGMMVETDDGGLYAVFGEWLLAMDDRMDLDEYTRDLKHDCEEDWSIVRVYDVCDECLCDIRDIFDTDNLVLIWEREKEYIEMTVEEIEKELGYKVKIVGENE